MTPPTVLVNSCIQISSKPKIDFVSKIFIICEIPVGVIRLPLLGNYILLTIIFELYALGLVGLFINVLNKNDRTVMYTIAFGSTFSQYLFLTTFNLIYIKKLQRIFKELNIFDKEVCCTPKIGKGTMRNIVYTALIIMYFCALYGISYVEHSFSVLKIEYIPTLACHALEVHFIGHLLSLIIPRLRLINYYMELSLFDTKLVKTTSAAEFDFRNGCGYKAHCEMEKLMNLYHTVIKAYTYLMEAIKWQFLVMITNTFITVLSISYDVAYFVIKDKCPLITSIIIMGAVVGLLLPLFGPCTLSDQVHNEVRRLRELLALRLYENKLDKSSRGIARALLAWTETRDLSFSLLRMLKINIFMPFKFSGLIVTYLIILLQFQKVVNG